MSEQTLWKRYTQYLCSAPEIGLSLDISRMKFSDAFFEEMRPAIGKALQEMAALEKGAIANPDEGRMVGHYWLRNPSLAPSAAMRLEIESAVNQVSAFAEAIHSG
ncbi:MAG: glucose-6-phosphate isomerase, partial [Deltaproteobacteria bacterium]|nr:glucose-6-phosphate isomerase [Deltaproteobacteria bacterium]